MKTTKETLSSWSSISMSACLAWLRIDARRLLLRFCNWPQRPVKGMS